MKATLTRALVLGGAGWLLGAAPVEAQALALQISAGRVTLQAEDVPVRSILEHWSRIADVAVVNADLLPNARVTLRLENVHESDALAVLLRDVKGYILARRPLPAGGAQIDRIMIVPMTQRAAGESPAFVPAAVTLPSPMSVAADAAGDAVVPFPPPAAEADVADADIADAEEPVDTTPDDVPEPGPRGFQLPVISPALLSENPQAAMAEYMKAHEARMRQQQAEAAAAANAAAATAPTNMPAGIAPSPSGAASGTARPGEVTPAPASEPVAQPR